MPIFYRLIFLLLFAILSDTSIAPVWLSRTGQCTLPLVKVDNRRSHNICCWADEVDIGLQASYRGYMRKVLGAYTQQPHVYESKAGSKRDCLKQKVACYTTPGRPRLTEASVHQFVLTARLPAPRRASRAFLMGLSAITDIGRQTFWKFLNPLVLRCKLGTYRLDTH